MQVCRTRQYGPVFWGQPAFCMCTMEPAVRDTRRGTVRSSGWAPAHSETCGSALTRRQGSLWQSRPTTNRTMMMRWELTSNTETFPPPLSLQIVWAWRATCRQLGQARASMEAACAGVRAGQLRGMLQAWHGLNQGACYSLHHLEHLVGRRLGWLRLQQCWASWRGRVRNLSAARGLAEAASGRVAGQLCAAAFAAWSTLCGAMQAARRQAEDRRVAGCAGLARAALWAWHGQAKVPGEGWGVCVVGLSTLGPEV